MADSSSISNFEQSRERRWPWGLIGAALLVIGVELVLRGIGRTKLIAFASDEGQYRAVRDFVDAQGPAEVALIGSSQLREGVSMPRLTEYLQHDVGRPVWAANYSMRGARVDVIDAAVRFLLRQPRPPKVIVVGLAARDVRAESIDWPRVAIFWSIGDWFREARAEPSAALRVLPVVVRTEAGRAIWSLRYREEISLWLQRRFARFGVDGSEDRNPIIGEMTAQHVGPKGLANYQQTGLSLRRMFDRVAESYRVKQKPAVPAAMNQRLQSLAAATAGERGVFWVELPVAPPLANWLSEIGQKATFDAAMVRATTVRAATGKGFAYFSTADQPIRPGPAVFRDLQHLNYDGAQLFSRWLSTEIAKRVPAKAE